MALLPPDRFPRWSKRPGRMSSCETRSSTTAFGTDLFIAGVRAMAPQP